MREMFLRSWLSSLGVSTSLAWDRLLRLQHSGDLSLPFEQAVDLVTNLPSRFQIGREVIEGALAAAEPHEVKTEVLKSGHYGGEALSNQSCGSFEFCNGIGPVLSDLLTKTALTDGRLCHRTVQPDGDVARL